MKELSILALTIDSSNEEIHDFMRKGKWLRENRPNACIVAVIAGYDNDKRELWQIPEVRAFSSRLIGQGFISYLDYYPSAMMGGVQGLGAVELILIAECKGQMPDSLGEEDFARFDKLICESNERADILLGPMKEQHHGSI